MATLHAPFQLRGRFNDLIIARGPNGTQRAYLRTPHDRRKYLKEHPGSPANISVVAFATASKVGSAIIRALPGELETRPYAHNHLNARIFPHIFHHRDPGEARLPVLGAIHRIIGAELGHHTAPSNHIRVTPIGPRHKPDALHFHGLHNAARTLGSAQGLQCRLSIHRIMVPLAHIDEDRKCVLDRKAGVFAEHITEWFGADLIPDTGIRMDLPQHYPDLPKIAPPAYVTAHLATPTLIIVAVEWRRLRKRARPLPLKTSTTVRITGLHIPDHSPDRQALLGHDTILALQVQDQKGTTKRYRLQKPSRRRAEAHEAAHTHTRTQTQTPQQLLEKAIGTRQRT